MRHILHGLFVLGMGLAPVLIAPPFLQAAWAQSQLQQNEALKQLLDRAAQYTQQGKLQQAIATLQQALKLARQLQDQSSESLVLVIIGTNLRNTGKTQQALEYYNQALSIVQAVGDRRGEAVTLNNIGGVYSDLGQLQQALEYYNQALPIRQAIGDRRGEAVTLNNIGGVYSDLGQLQQALTFYKQALPSSKRCVIG